MMKFVADHDGQSVEYILKDGINVIGRDEECDIAIDNTQISRNHVSVMVGPEGAVIQDLNSRNGTFVNGLKVTNTAQIKHGDVVSLGKYLMKCIADTPAQPEEQPTAPLTVEPPEAAADTLPFKGKYAKMMGGGSSESLPAKFDPSRYQIEVHGQRIIVTDPSTSQAIELYRGTPDAAILDKLLADRRRRERRNILLGVGGGIAALVVIIVLAKSVLQPPPKVVPAKFDAKAYYSLLNQSVEAFNKNMADPEVNALLDKAEKVPGRSNSVTYHVQLHNIFRLKRDALDDALLDNPKKGGNWTEMLKVIETFGEMPDTGDISVTRQFIEETKTTAEDEQENWEHIDSADIARRQFDERKAVVELRKINPRSIYLKSAQGMIDELVPIVADKLLDKVLKGLTLDGVKTVKAEDLDMKKVTQYIDAANDLLKNKFFRNLADRDALEKFVRVCQDFRETARQKLVALEDAKAKVGQGKFLEAYREIEYLLNDPDEGISTQAKAIELEYNKWKAEEQSKQNFETARKEVVTAYNRGEGEKALELIDKYSVVLSNDEWLILKNKIERVLENYDKAKAALETDPLLAKQCYENINSLEDSQANFYRQESGKFVVEWDQRSVDEKVRIYIEGARKRLKEGNYITALEYAAKANSLYKEGEKVPGKQIRISVNMEGEKRRRAAIDMHDVVHDTPKAIAMLEEILDKHIYFNDDDSPEGQEGNAIYNGCISLLNGWKQELPGEAP